MFTKVLIPATEIIPHSLSHADPQGRLFTWHGSLYRGIPESSAAFCHRLFDEGIIRKLVDKGLLVPTVRTGYITDEFSLVLQHDKVPFVSYPFEWSGEMMRDAALHTLSLLEELAPHGLTLKDAHGWNVLFEGTRPMFVDFGSIVATGGEGVQIERVFLENFVYPLDFLAKGQGRIVRRLLQDYERGIDINEHALLGRFSSSISMHGLMVAGKAAAKRYLPAPLLNRLRGQVRKVKRTKAVKSYKVLRLDGLRARLQAIKFPAGGTKWSGYYSEEFPPLAPDPSWTPKHRAVHELLRRYQPATVLDIGANQGWFSMLAAKGGARAIALDTDELCLNRLHLDAKREALNVQALVMSFTQPSPRCGLGNGVTHPAADRLKCDLVLGLALAHHMVFSAHLNFAQIAAGFAAFTGKILVVEFVPHDDQHVRKWMSDRFAWYTLENFVAALKLHFTVITPVASHPHPRVLLVCAR